MSATRRAYSLVAQAEKLIDDVDGILDEAGREHFDERAGALALVEATRAQALATLALVEQQRIANLLCMATTDAAGSHGQEDAHAEAWVQLGMSDILEERGHVWVYPLAPPVQPERRVDD